MHEIKEIFAFSHIIGNRTKRGLALTFSMILFCQKDADLHHFIIFSGVLHVLDLV